MEFFQRAKVFRLKCSGQSKYLKAHKDEETIGQSRDKTSNNARWTYELVEGKPKLIRLRSCCSWRYLATSEDPFLLGMKGKKIVQTISSRPIIEWEPIKEGSYIKLKSHAGTFLRANRGPPPWRNYVTHDEPGHWTGSENMTLWIVDIIEIDYQSSRMGNGGSTSSEEVKGINVASLSCNVADKKVVSSPAYFSPMGNFDQSGPAATDVSSSAKHSANVNTTNATKSDTVSEYSVQSTLGCVQPFKVKRAKQTFEQLRSKKFHTILYTGQHTKLEKAVDELIAVAKSVGQGEIPSKLVQIQQQLKSIKSDYESASKDLVEYSTFSTKRSEIRDKLKKDAAKARELESFEVNVSNKIIDARAKREELLKQLEETENSIKNIEKARADSMSEVNELISRIEQKSKWLKEMENKEKSWQVRKNEAERMLERVEKQWERVKFSFPDVC